MWLSALQKFHWILSPWKLQDLYRAAVCSVLRWRCMVSHVYVNVTVTMEDGHFVSELICDSKLTNVKDARLFYFMLKSWKCRIMCLSTFTSPWKPLLKHIENLLYTWSCFKPHYSVILVKWDYKFYVKFTNFNLKFLGNKSTHLEGIIFRT